MGKMQEALKKAEEARARNLAAPRASAGPSQNGATATSFAISAPSRTTEVDPHLVAMTDRQSRQAAQYRALRDAVLAMNPAQPHKVIVVTSSLAGEGKSLTSLNLACSLAENAEKRVVVVDADLHTPSLHRLLGIDNQRGLADYLGGGTMVEMVLQRAGLPNLWAMPSGHAPPNPGELIGGKRMEDLLSRLRRDFDHVIIDSPPVVSAADASALAPRADGAILVVRAARTPASVARHAVDLLKKARANVLGSVVTAADAVSLE